MTTATTAKGRVLNGSETREPCLDGQGWGGTLRDVPLPRSNIFIKVEPQLVREERGKNL